MMVREFCDICGTETTFHDRNTMSFHDAKGLRDSVFRDPKGIYWDHVCLDCTPEIRDMLVGFKKQRNQTPAEKGK